MLKKHFADFKLRSWMKLYKNTAVGQKYVLGDTNE